MSPYDHLPPYVDDTECLIVIVAGLCDLTSKAQRNRKIIVNHEQLNSSEDCPLKNVVRVVDILKQIKGVLPN